jgi:nitrate reductase delta subunit
MPLAVTFVDRLAELLEYPDDTFSPALGACRAELTMHASDAAARFEQFAHEVERLSTGRLQELYTQTFDLNPTCTLDIGWHLFGEAYERGLFLAAMRDELRGAGVEEGRELPDHLPSLLRLMARMDAQSRAALERLIRPAVAKLAAALRARESPYEHLVETAFAAAALGD